MSWEQNLIPSEVITKTPADLKSGKAMPRETPLTSKSQTAFGQLIHMHRVLLFLKLLLTNSSITGAEQGSSVTSN